MAAQMRLARATVQGLFGDSGGMARAGGLESFTAPVLLMLGSETTPIFRATVRALAARLPNAEVAVIEGAGHMLPISHPEETGQRLRDWMERTGQVAAGGSDGP
jgi:pimeloyl-ACP methyl ester carboxylesterase